MKVTSMDSTKTGRGHGVRIVSGFSPLAAAKTRDALVLAFDTLVVFLVTAGWLWVMIDLIAG